MCFCKDVLIFFYCRLFSLYTVLRTSLSLSHYYPIDYKQSLCRVSICTSYTSIEKKSTTESERGKETATTNYTIPKKKKKKKKKKKNKSNINKKKESNNFIITKIK